MMLCSSNYKAMSLCGQRAINDETANVWLQVNFCLCQWPNGVASCNKLEEEVDWDDVIALKIPVVTMCNLDIFFKMVQFFSKWYNFFQNGTFLFIFVSRARNAEN